MERTSSADATSPVGRYRTLCVRGLSGIGARIVPLCTRFAVTVACVACVGPPSGGDESSQDPWQNGDSIPQAEEFTRGLDSVILGESMCKRCRIHLERLARLGSRDGPDAFGEFPSMTFAINSQGDIFAGGLYTQGEIRRFDESGAFLGKFGRTGEGPGEQGFVTHLLVGVADTLYVVDKFARTLNRFTPSGEFIDKTLLPGHFESALPLDGRRLLVTGNLRTTTAVGFPLHIVDTTGLTMSFGEELAHVTPATVSQLIRSVARDAGGGLWSARMREYTVQRWTAPGTLASTLRRNVAWFVSSEETGSPQPMEGRPTSRIYGLWDSGDGYLWVYILVPDPEWRPGRFQFDPATGMNRLMEHSMDPFFDSVIEVIDLSRAAVLLRWHDDRVLTPVGDGPFLYSYKEDANGVPQYQFWRVSLSTSRGGRE